MAAIIYSIIFHLQATVSFIIPPHPQPKKSCFPPIFIVFPLASRFVSRSKTTTNFYSDFSPHQYVVIVKAFHAIHHIFSNPVNSQPRIRICVNIDRINNLSRLLINYHDIPFFHQSRNNTENPMMLLSQKLTIQFVRYIISS